MNERDLFITALQIEAAAERCAYLDKACSDDSELRRRVQALLAAFGQAGSFLQQPAANPVANSDVSRTGSAVDSIPAERSGTVVGPYKLLQQIGEGGMGIVWMAEQTQPVQRKVALKLIKSGMDSKRVIVRFEVERQALALMDHPNIAKVLDAGTTEGGRPYFVMELVKGVPITKYCDEHRLTPKQRLELFVPVCQAVQHAHQKGIIHRDLKPSNVMVCLYDGKPVPKVIDFGVAKAAGQKLTERTMFTEIGQVVGTLEYMSPEQAELNQLDIDTRSDIYSLGVLLYELLTGSTPLERKRLKAAAMLEALRLIREEEPPKPSTRLSTTDELPSVATSRGLEPKKLSGLVRGELDWIVMRALEKDRNRRYETANGLAMDLQRYLNDEPVAACPPSAGYRFRKFVRRNRGALMTVAIVAAALFVGTAVSVWQAILATEAANSERQALTNLAKEQQVTRQALLDLGVEQKTTKLELFESLVAQARANRLSRRIGQRFGTLELIRKATAMAYQLKLPAGRFLELRNEAIAALALPDLRVVKERPGVSYDSALERYTHVDLNGNLVVRRASDDKEIFRLADLGPGEHWPTLSPDGGYVAVFGRGRRHVFVWRLGPVVVPSEIMPQQEPIRILDEPALGAWCFSPDSRHLALQHADGSIGIFELATSTSMHRLPPMPQVNQMRFHPAGDRLALAVPRRFAKVIDLPNGNLFWWQNVNDPYPAIGWHPDGKILAVGDGVEITLWNVARNKPVAKVKGFQGGGISLTFDPSGNLLASNSWAGMLRLWDPLNNRQLFSAQLSGEFQFSADGRFLTARQDDTNLWTWEIAAGHEYRSLVASPLKGKREYSNAAITPSGRFLAAGARGGIALWDLPTGKELAFVEGSQFNFVAFENRPPRQGEGEKQEKLLATRFDGLFRWPIQFERESGAVQIGPAEKQPVPVNHCMFASSRDEKVMAFSQHTPGAVVWHADQPDQLIKLEHHDVRHVAVSPDGRWIATGRFSHPGGAKIWQVGPMGEPPTKGLTYKPVKDLPSGEFYRVVFSPDGKGFLTGPAVGVGPIRRWEMATWAETPFKEPIKGQNASFSPDGKLLVVETGVGVARLLDADTGREYARLEDPDQHRTVHFVFTSDGTKLVCSTWDGYCVHVWDLQAIRRQLAEMDLNWK